MRKIFFRGLLKYGIWALPLALPAQPGIFPKLDMLARQYTSHPQNRGLSVAILYNGTVHYAGYGRLSKNNTTPPDEHTLFELGALGGTFAPALLAIEEARGQIRPSTTISQVLPAGFSAPAFIPERFVAVTPAPSAENPRPVREVICIPDPIAGPEEITLCQLAYHTSGIGYPSKPLYRWHPLAFAPPQRTEQDFPGAEDIFRLAERCTFTHPPGERFAFSNIGIAYLGHLLAARRHLSYDTLLWQYLTAPLNMPDTRIFLTPVQQKKLAPGHQANGRPAAFWHFDAMAPAAGVKSSARDMMQYLRAILQQTPGIPPGAALQIRQAVIGVQFPGWRRPTSAAYGWLVSTTDNNRSVVWMNGGTEGFRTFAAFDPQRQIAIVVLSNSARDVTELGFAMLQQL